MGSGGRVQFDFDGSLALARALWALAGDLVTEDVGRETQYDTAIAKWEGKYATDFAGRRATERTSRSTVRDALRDDARLWAEAWARALHQQNKNNRVAEVERISDDRGGFTKLVDATVGEDDSESKVPMPEYPPVPQPPGFAPTATEVTY
jgi:hypothetical protein